MSSLDILLDGRRPRYRARILLAEALEQARLLEGLHRVPAHILPVQRVAGDDVALSQPHLGAAIDYGEDAVFGEQPANLGMTTFRSNQLRLSAAVMRA